MTSGSVGGARSRSCPDLPDALVGVDADPGGGTGRRAAARRRPGCAAGPAPRLPRAARAVRRGRLGLRGDRRHPRHPSWHRAQPHPPWSGPAAEGAERMSAHLDDLLSAYADGELTADAAGRGRRPPRAVPGLPRELAATRAGQVLGGQPAARSCRRSGSTSGCCSTRPASGRGGSAGPSRIGAIGLAATASIWLAVVGLAPASTAGRPAGMPALNSFVSLHQGSATPTPDAPSASTEDPAVQRRAAALGLPPEHRRRLPARPTCSTAARSSRPSTPTASRPSRCSSSCAIDVDESQLPAGSTVRLPVGGQPVWIVPYQGRARCSWPSGGPAPSWSSGPEPASPSMTERRRPALDPVARSPIGSRRRARACCEAFGLG